MALTTIPVELVTLDDGVTITVDDNLDTLTLTSTDADASVGPVLNLYRNSSSPADSDIIGAIDYDGRNDNSQDVLYSRIIGVASDVSDGTEDGALYLQTIVAGTTRDRVSLLPTEIAVNDGGIDLDFRVESDGNANRLFVDAGADKVLFGTTASRNMSGVTSSLFQEGTSYDLASLGLVANTNASNGAYLMLGTSRGTSNGSSTIVQDNDELGGIFWHGADGTDIASAAAFVATYVDGTPGSNDMPGRLVFATTADGASTATERMRLDSTGVLRLKAGTASTGASSEDSYITHVNTGSTFLNLGTNYTDDAAATQIMNNTTVIAKFTKAGVTMPLQPNVGVNINGSNQDNLAANVVTLDFDDARFDQNSDFTAGTNTFAAPITGKYLVCVNLYMLNIDTAADYYQLYVATSNKTYYALFDPGVLASDPVYWTLSWSGVVDMDASDTCLFKLNQSGGAAQTDINNNSYASITLLN